MAYQLPELPYPHDALEPHIDTATMEIHHGKHHAAYVNNLNAALEGQDALKGKTIEAILADLEMVPDTIRLPLNVPLVNVKVPGSTVPVPLKLAVPPEMLTGLLVQI